MSDNKELDAIICHWKDGLAEHRLQMEPNTVYLVEQTILCLEELKGPRGQRMDARTAARLTRTMDSTLHEVYPRW